MPKIIKIYVKIIITLFLIKDFQNPKTLIKV